MFNKYNRVYLCNITSSNDSMQMLFLYVAVTNNKYAIIERLIRMKSKESNNKSNYDSILLRVNKGGKDLIKHHADSRSESMNEYIKQAIRERIKRTEAAKN